MKSAIREKLQVQLNKKIEDEAQAVYILSRVRKILEIDGKEKEEEYGKLKFYCDWALHPVINNTKAVQEILDGIIARKPGSGSDLAVQFETFHYEFKKFLREYGLTTTIYDSDENRFYFERSLSQIYADTPLVIDEKIKIRWFGNAGEQSFGGSFKIEDVSHLSRQEILKSLND